MSDELKPSTKKQHFVLIPLYTVDGRNLATVDMVNIPLFTRLHTCWVVQDFFHQQFLLINFFNGTTNCGEKTTSYPRCHPFLHIQVRDKVACIGE